MAIPNTLGALPYPHHNSPQRIICQYQKSGSTQGTMIVVGTISAKTFCITKLQVAVTGATTGASVSLELKGDEILALNATAQKEVTLDLFPGYIQSAVVNTSTIKIISAGNTVGSAVFVQGFWK